MLSAIIFCVALSCCYTDECGYAECHFAECHGIKIDAIQVYTYSFCKLERFRVMKNYLPL
jgi:hypothetical protein